MNELITVIINVYNREKHIGKCIESVIKQTYKNLEVLIINDGSTDNTLKVCESYKDDRIRIISTKNLGLSLSRNVGIDNAKGEYLYFVDSDDFIKEDTIEYLYNLCKRYNSDITTCKTLTIHDYKYKDKKVKEKVEVLDSKGMLKKVLLAKDYSGTTWNKLIKRDLFEGIRFENRIINDIANTYKLVIKSNNIVYSNQYKYYYLKHKNAITIKEYEDYNRLIDLYEASYERYCIVKDLLGDFEENEFGLARNILKIYTSKDKKIEEYLRDKEAFRYVKKLKVFKGIISFKLKIAIIVFTINPKLYRFIARIVLKLKY